jgi:hypothetical protein
MFQLMRLAPVDLKDEFSYLKIVEKVSDENQGIKKNCRLVSD